MPVPACTCLACLQIQVYPATLFTSAPLPVLRDALRAAADQGSQSDTAHGAAAAAGSPSAAPATPGWGPLPPTHSVEQAQDSAASPAASRSQVAAAALQSTSSSGSGSGPSSTRGQGPSQSQLLQQQAVLQQQQSQQQLLRCSLLSVSTPSGVPIVQDLQLQVLTGGCVLIKGPSGCGKSTLVSCLAGLWPPEVGSISIPPATSLDSAQGPATTTCSSSNRSSWGTGTPAVQQQAG